jgi:hypothetical protein
VGNQPPQIEFPQQDILSPRFQIGAESRDVQRSLLIVPAEHAFVLEPRQDDRGLLAAGIIVDGGRQVDGRDLDIVSQRGLLLDLGDLLRLGGSSLERGISSFFWLADDQPSLIEPANQAL